jgi:exodeoxyribonuclease V gamma subunit
MRIEVEDFVSKIERFTRAPSRKPLDFDLHLAGFDLKGRVSDITESGWVHIRYARKSVRNILSSWIYHLVMCHAAPPDYPRTSFLICKDSAIQYGPVPESEAVIGNLLNLFRSGLEAPVHFFPETSHVYAHQKLTKSLSDPSALAKAGQKWRGGIPPRKFTKAESDDRYYDLCFRHRDPLDDEFANMALTVFEPLFAHSQEIIL